MKVVCQFSRTRVAANIGHNLHLLVRLCAPPLPTDAVRPPLCIVPVVDVSGSMAGRKLRAVRDALERLIDHLVPGDRVSLVTFDSRVRTPVPLVEMSEARKGDLRRAIQALRAGSNTNLAGGLIEGVRQAHSTKLPAGMRARVILLTDGLANEGPAVTPDALVKLGREQSRGLTLSAFGYGDDCDQTMLSDLAAAGRGSYAYIQSSDTVLTAFARELGGLVSTYAADVSVRLVPLAGAPIEDHLGDLLYHGELQWIASVAAPLNGRAQGVPVCAIEVRWRDAWGQEQRLSVPGRIDYVLPGEAQQNDDPDVLRASDQRSLRQAQELAEARARRQDYPGARQAIHDVIGRLHDTQLAVFARDMLLPCYQDQAHYSQRTSIRASSISLLRGQRQVSLDPSVAQVLTGGDSPSIIEVSMEQSFRSLKAATPPSPSSSGGPALPGRKDRK